MNDYVDSGFAVSKVVAVAASASECPLAILPSEVLECVLGFCDAETLAAFSQTCLLFRAFDAGSGMRLTEKTAKAAVQAVAGQQGDRWRSVLWNVCFGFGGLQPAEPSLMQP
jgi:hypothetical protein